MSEETKQPEPPSAEDSNERTLGRESSITASELDAQMWREFAEVRALRIQALEQRLMLVTGVVYGLLLALWIVMLHQD